MRKANAAHVINCDIETYWKVFLDAEFTKKMHLDELGSKKLEILELTDNERRMAIVPTLAMPGPVMKALGDSFGYEEVCSLDRERNIWSWKLVPNKMTDRLKTSGTMRLEAMDDGKCRRIDEATMEAKVFGIGGLFERSTEKEVVSTWEKEASFINRWLAER